MEKSSELVERALELWPRVSEDARPAGVDHVDLLSDGGPGVRDLGPVAAIGGPVPPRARRGRPRLRSAAVRVAAVAPGPRPAGLNRAPEAIETAERALAMLPEEEGARERASLLAWLGRTRWLRGRYRDAIADAEVALAAAIEAGDRSSESEVLNTLGMAQIVLGEVRRGGRPPAPGDRDRAGNRGRRRHQHRVREPGRPARARGSHPGGGAGRQGGARADPEAVHARPTTGSR